MKYRDYRRLMDQRDNLVIQARRSAAGRMGGHTRKGKTDAQRQAEKSEIEAYLSREPNPIKWL